jgi:cytochrome c peroxidase
MGTTKEHAVEQLKGTPGYVEAFKMAYPEEADPVTYDTIEKAIAVFEATLITPNAPFDRWLKGEAQALTAEEKEGLALFIDKGCASCHNGINIGGGMYAPFGVVQKPGWEFLPPDDKGRYQVTATVSDEYVFKVPTLRNIALTAPYFHSGHAWDLKQAVAVMGTAQLGAELSEEEAGKIAAFLASLTGEQPQVIYPILPPSTARRRRRDATRAPSMEQRSRRGPMAPVGGLDAAMDGRRSPGHDHVASAGPAPERASSS